MPSVLSKVSSKFTTKSTALVSVTIISIYFLNLRNKRRASRNVKDLHIKLNDGFKKEEKAAVDLKFFQQLIGLCKILLPSVCSAEVGYLVLVAFLLITRTYCDVWMIRNGTAIESGIIGRNKELFKHHLFKFLYAMPTVALVNNLLKMGLSELKLRFRTRLTHHLYDKYMKGFTYYQMSNLDSRISNVDQLMTQDVEKFCDCVAELYSNLSKPILDIFIYAIKLASAIGAQGPGYMFLYLIMSGLFLTRIRRSLGRMTMVEQQYEGEFRFVNSRLITNCEEVAFYRGNAKELSILHTTFTKLVDHLRDLIDFRFKTGIVDSLIAKYVATTVGYLVVSRPFMDLSNPRLLTSTHSQRVEYYYESGRMLISMAQAIGRIVLSGRDMSRLSGYTARIIQLQQVLHDLNRGRYVRTMVDSSSNNGVADPNHSLNSENGFEVIPKRRGTNLVPGSGNVIQMDHIIKFEQVPLITPNGDILVEELNFEVKAGTNVIVVGPNGCGKSSLFRILGGLWPIFGGTLTKPGQNKLFYIPQRPYMALGTLRDQIIYPDAPGFMRMKNVTDSDLASYLEKVQLSYILDREGGWDAVQDWSDVLSGGEKQRIAMARLFYHKPQFAILDECTSAVSVDVEGAMYRFCREMGITLFTVSHRKSLWQHHEYYLHMDGRGGFEFKPITETTDQFGS